MRYNKKDKPYLGSGGPRDQQRRQNLQDSGGVDPAVAVELRKQLVELRKELAVPKSHYTGEQVDKEIRKAVQGALTETGKDGDFERIKQLEEDIVELKKINKDKETAIQELNEKIVAGKDDVISTKYNVDAKMKNEIKEVQENADALVVQLAEFENKNTVQAKEVIKLEAKIDGLTDIISSKDEMIKSIKEANGSADLVELITAQNKQIEQLTAILDIKGVDLDPNRPKMQKVVIDPTGKKKLEPHIDIKDVSFKEKVKMDVKVDKLKNLLGELPAQKKANKNAL